MAASHSQGPHIAFGQAQGDYNPNLGPSLSWGGVGLFDPRAGYQPGQANASQGWMGGLLSLINQVPAVLAANNIAASQTPVAATPLTLVSATGAGITAGASVVNLLTGQTVSNLLAIDGAAALISFGATPKVKIYDPTTMVARAVRVHSAGNDTGATFTVRGYDIYGAPMSETITGGTGADANGKKAFKYIASVTPAGTLSGSAVTVGTTDIYGFPLKVLEWQDTWINYGAPPSPLVTSSTGFVAAVTTDPATATTGDVRGTYALQSASDGTNKLSVKVLIQPNVLAPVGGVYVGLFGVAQFTN